MFRYLLITIIIPCSLALNSQQRIISGEVVNTNGMPLIGVEISQDQLKKYDTNYSYSDINGIWAIKLNVEANSYIHFNYRSYLSQAVRIDTTQPMKIIMEEAAPLPSDDLPELYFPSTTGFGIFQFGIDFNQGNYDGYRPLLGDITTDFLDNVKPIIYVGLGYERTSWMMRLNIGYTPSFADQDLTIKNTSDNFMLDIVGGYKIFDSRRWKLITKGGFKYLNYNLENTVLEDDATLSEYLDNPDIELNFSQPFTYLGLDLEYKFYTDDEYLLRYWTIGLYGNYLFKLKRNPYLGTKNVSLSSEIPIEFQKVNWGIAGRMYFGSRI
ncbi:MAG: hypothetical protein HKN68_13445 [Saprospiraceae bacterium]|nr:hypothetical protein [Saprospiraceae bacterium]